jgi:hypothetical protein
MTDQPKPPAVLSRRLCGQCGKPYRPLRSDARFCSDTCRQRAHRARITVTKRDTHDTELVEQGESAMSETDKPKTPPPSDPVAPAPDTFRGRDENGIDSEFRYVRQEAVAQLVAEGWTATPFIPGGSGDFAFMMQRPAPQTDSPEDQTA